MFFINKPRISINVKLLAGLDQRAGYDAERGIDLQVPDKTKVKKLKRLVALPQDQPISFIINGEKAKPGDRLQDGDEVFCFLPFSGG